jgi:phage FluMu protein Com
MGLKQYTTDEIIIKLKTFYNDYDYDYSKTIYKNSSTPIEINCNEHGIFKTYSYKLFKNPLHICPKCKKNQINIRVTNTESFIKKASLIHNNQYIYDNTIYNGNDKILNITCKEHGNFNLIADDHLSGRKCPKCKKSHALTKEEVLTKFHKIHNNKYEYPEFIYNTVYDYINITCLTHGDFKQKIMTHLRGHGCKECAKDSLRKDTYDFIKRSQIIHNNKYDYSQTHYKHSQQKLNIICPKHGEFSQIARDHLLGMGCWKCGIEGREKTSSYEVDIINYIKSQIPNINIIQSYSLHRKEIDIYLPEYKLGIEFNGNYWHSHLFKDKKYHKEKSDFFKNHNINIFHIWEYDWINKNNIIKSMINNKLKINSNKIYARKCIIKNIQSKEFKIFCENNHIQGYCASKIKLGLYYNDKLVACMGIGKLRRNLGNKNSPEHSYELLRYCTLLNVNIVGGASKLINYFKQNYNPKTLISYCNNDYSNGLLYEKLNFKLENIKISYSYYNPKTQTNQNRYNYRKSELIKLGYDDKLTEFEIITSMGLYKLYNSGTSKYILEF